MSIGHQYLIKKMKTSLSGRSITKTVLQEEDEYPVWLFYTQKRLKNVQTNFMFEAKETNTT